MADSDETIFPKSKLLNPVVTVIFSAYDCYLVRLIKNSSCFHYKHHRLKIGEKEIIQV
ncbi:MAG: hypothetical protein SCK70_12805 [bacterium]|nr:hypothetical protein [bacterium]